MINRKKWTRNELMIALNIYQKLNFGQFDSKNPVITQIAQKMGRTPGALAMKLSNLASFDPALKLRGIRGLSGASHLDQEVWDEFHHSLNQMVPESEEMVRNLLDVDTDSELEVLPKVGIKLKKSPPTGPTHMIADVKVRRGQDYFRQAILNNYSEKCAVTGLPIRELLIASHILPWGTNEKERLNVSNGICLSRLHDAAFDRGLISFDSDLKMVLSRKIKSCLPQTSIEANFTAYEGKPITLPEDAILPDKEFLTIHRKSIFLNS